MSDNECHFVTEISQIFSNLSKLICLICIDLKDFAKYGAPCGLSTRRRQLSIAGLAYIQKLRNVKNEMWLLRSGGGCQFSLFAKEIRYLSLVISHFFLSLRQKTNRPHEKGSAYTYPNACRHRYSDVELFRQVTMGIGIIHIIIKYFLNSYQDYVLLCQ